MFRQLALSSTEAPVLEASAKFSLKLYRWLVCVETKNGNKSENNILANIE